MPDHSIEFHHPFYDRNRFSWRQVRDSIEGANSIKRAAEIYLPMPSGMLFDDTQASEGQRQATTRFVHGHGDYDSQWLPWFHPNPAYRAYLQRARFPDMTVTTLRGLIGIATRQEPMFELPSSIDYLEDLASVDRLSLNELYAFTLSEVLQVGKFSLVLDVREDGTVYFAPYSAESNIYWETDIIDGEHVSTLMVFEERHGHNFEEHLEAHFRKYWLDPVTGNAMTAVFHDNLLVGEIVELSIKGKTLKRLPIVTFGVIQNDPFPALAPLFGISDIAVAIYRKDADLSQAQFLTCNPTLFVTGVSETEIPKVIGSSIAVGLSNPIAKAFYPETDTSALDHILKAIQDLMQEAMSYGASMLGPRKKAAEATETLQLREAASGATLVTTVRHVSEGMEELLNLASQWAGNGEEVLFDASIDFAERSLSAQGLTALVSTWVQGGISQDTLLDNLRDTNIIDSEIDNEAEKARIMKDKEANFAAAEKFMRTEGDDGGTVNE